jgi:hypothetical protein
LLGSFATFASIRRAAEPEVIYLSPEEQETGQLGYRDFNAQLFARPLPWWD